MLKNKKCLILIIVLIAIITAGIVVLAIKGANYSVNYDNSVSLQIYIDADVEMNDIKDISKEVFGNKEVALANANKSSGQILMTVKEASEEKIALLVEKINAKYETEYETSDIEIMDNYKVALVDIIAPYIIPVVICLIVVLIYFGIMYRKHEILPILIHTIIIPLVAQLGYFSILVITRLPIGMFTMPISMLIFIISLLGIAFTFNNKYSNKTEDKKRTTKKVTKK